MGDLLSNPPSPQRQRLQFPRGRFNKPPESNNADNHTHDIHNIISVPLDIAYSTPFQASVFLSCDGAAERVGYEGSFEVGRGGRGRDASCDCEGIDEFEDEEAGEGTA